MLCDCTLMEKKNEKKKKKEKWVLPGGVLDEEEHRFKFVWKLLVILLSVIRIYIAL